MAGGRIGAAMQSLFGRQQNQQFQVTAAPASGEQAKPAAGTQSQASGDRSQVLESGVQGELDAEGKPIQKNPLDQFSDIWQPPKGADGKPIPKPDTKLFNIEPAKFFEHAAKQDFRKFVKPETLARIAKGGDDGNAAMSDLIQDLGSNIFATSALASTKMIEKAMETQKQQFESSLPELFKKLNLGENLRTKNPALNHPAAQPIVEALKTTLAQRYPEASAAELQETAETFLSTFASEVGGKKSLGDDKGSGSGRKSPGDQDWSSFLPDGLQ